jgi:hypothetical protein
VLDDLRLVRNLGHFDVPKRFNKQPLVKARQEAALGSLGGSFHFETGVRQRRSHFYFGRI